MADLEEIMAGKGAPAPGPDIPTQEHQDQRPPQEPVQPQERQPSPEPQPGEADPITGLRKALDEERGKRRKYRDELAEVRQQMARLEGFLSQQRQQPPQPQQPPPEPPAIWDNPGGYVDHHLREAVTPIQRQLGDTRRELGDTREQFSRMMAVDKFGEEAVNAAFADLSQRIQADPGARFEWQRIMASPHPYGALVESHKQRSVLNEVGTDPAAYREKLKAEILAELGQPASQPQPHGGAPPQALPASLAAARSAGPRTAPQWSGPKPLSELMPR